VREIFGETRVPILKDLPIAQAVSVNGAFRYSDYNLKGVGAVWTYSGGLNWKLDENITFRGQYQRAIRAPNVGELFGGTALNFASNTIDPCGGNEPVALQTAALKAQCIATGVPAGNVWTTVVQDASKLVGQVTGGNPNLKAEASDTITFGTVLTPDFIPGLSASIDYYSTDVKGAITPFGGSASGVLTNCYATSNANDPNCLAIHRDSSGAIAAPSYINLGETNLSALKVEGIDWEGDYIFTPGWDVIGAASTVSIGADWTLAMEDKALSGLPGSVWTNCVGAYGNSCGEPQPRWKGLSHVTWRNGPVAITLRWRFIDSVVNDRYLIPLRTGIGTVTPLAQITNAEFPIYNYFDLSGSYDITNNMSVSGGVNNLFNLTPPISVNSAGFGNTWPSTYDSLGRMFFLNITARTN
jgi:iron complex outermembrane receptor protein